MKYLEASIYVLGALVVLAALLDEPAKVRPAPAVMQKKVVEHYREVPNFANMPVVSASIH